MPTISMFYGTRQSITFWFTVIIVGALVTCSVQGERVVTPLSVGFNSSLQYPASKDGVDVYGLRAGVWFNEYKNEQNSRIDVYGVSLGLLVMAEYTNSRVAGIQLSSLYSTADTLHGIQLACMNLADINGMQLACLWNGSNYLNGMQMAFCNCTTWGTGVQIGVFNLVEDYESLDADLSGIQLGAFNYALCINGLQIGAGNFSKDVSGIQLGIFNYAAHLKGLQIGLLNRHGDSYFPVLMVGW